MRRYFFFFFYFDVIEKYVRELEKGLHRCIVQYRLYRHLLKEAYLSNSVYVIFLLIFFIRFFIHFCSRDERVRSSYINSSLTVRSIYAVRNSSRTFILR